ncbi:Choline/ethanolaminephosphotransferase [Hanseniaspora valbyensis NRRL Y-1626]|uniref:diacylglycerol cholinephosphotransferase n=1 Tax=Hanseniaspora valbyensis NRRL Y-1626 TaxID=766949 RepID=A0A1B7TBN9_9ASCO|nr:Choline/ethanolaminephosphotransferase [Hanseniaspora valbyensis NRRL Y-1626]
MGFYVPANKIANLSKYKYQSEDRSIISQKILKPFWNKFVNVYPEWLAPNVITLSGFAFVLINLITCVIVAPDFQTEHPSWCYYSYAIGLFLYQTFDACDGLQARRTGQSGPLGELFDHCIDSLNTTVSMLVFTSVTMLGFSGYTVFMQFALLMNFYLSTWEEYHTHKLFLSEFSGPVEGILIIIASFILTGIVGPEAFWRMEIYKVTDSFTIESFHLVFAFCGLALIFNVIYAQKNVAIYYKNNSSSKHECDRKIRDSNIQLLPFFAFFATIFLVSFLDSKFINLTFIFSNGLIFAFVVGRIIVAHLTMQKFPLYNLPMILPLTSYIAATFSTYALGFDSDKAVTYASLIQLGLSLGIHGSFLSDIIYEFSQYLDIWVLRIKHPKVVKKY